MLGFMRSRKQMAEESARRPDTVPGALIDLRDVVKEYETPAGTFVALKGVDLRVDASEFVAVVGKSGSGKSTLNNMITGIDRPTSGEVIVSGTSVHTLSEGQTAIWRGRTIGVVFQFFQLLPTLTVLENIMLPMDFCNVYSDRERRERAIRAAGTGGDGGADGQDADRHLGWTTAACCHCTSDGDRPADHRGG